MTKHFLRDLERLNQDLMALGTFVQRAIAQAIRALIDRRKDLAETVIEGDAEIDQREVALEEECLKVLALHQPVAGDLRFVVAVLKVNNDLERMGDLAVNIAQRARSLGKRDPLELDLPFEEMSELVESMVQKSIEALVQSNLELAREVLESDDRVDDLHKKAFKMLQRSMLDDGPTIKRAMSSITVSKNLERIADLATNIAEDVVFMVEGQIIRHRMQDLPE